MQVPPDSPLRVPTQNPRSLIVVRATAVEAVAGDDKNAIELITDSEIALYRFRIEILQAMELSCEMMKMITTRVIHREIGQRI